MPRATTKKQTPDQVFADLRAVGERARQRHGIGRAAVDVDIADRPLSWWRERWDDAHRLLFIETHIKVRDPRHKSKLVRLKFNAMQRDLVTKRTGKDCCLKMRRGGMSTVWLALFFADAVVQSGQAIRIVPHTPKAEAKLFSDLKVMYRELPENVKPATRYFSRELIEFYDPAKGTLDSQINTQSVQPGHEESGRAEGFTHLHLTEVPFWRGDAKTAAVALMEAAEYGQIVMESTANGVEFFHQTYQQGKKSEAGWTSHFYEWFWRGDLRKKGARFEKVQSGEREVVALVPANETLDTDDQGAVERATLTKRERVIAMRVFRFLRKQGETTGYGFDWERDNDVAERIAWRRSKIQERGERNFLIEFPENDRECFEQTGRPVISAQWLNVTCQPREAEEGHEYLVSADCSLGLADGDPAAIQVLDLLTGRQCYEEELWLSPDLLGVKLAEISDRYNGAAIVVERNGPGIATLLKLISLGYDTRLYKHLDAPLRRQVEQGSLTMDEAKDKAQYGFPTSAENKALMGLKLEEAIRCGYLGLSSAAFCEQAKTVTWRDDKSWSSISGYHDDLMMALAIGNYVMRYEADMLPQFVGIAPEFGKIG